MPSRETICGETFVSLLAAFARRLDREPTEAEVHQMLEDARRLAPGFTGDPNLVNASRTA